MPQRVLFHLSVGPHWVDPRIAKQSSLECDKRSVVFLHGSKSVARKPKVMLVQETTYAERDLGRKDGQRTWKQYRRRTQSIVAVVEFPPNGASFLGGCPNAEYAGCRRGEARSDDLIPRAPLDWQVTKGRLLCRVIQLVNGGPVNKTKKED